MKCSESLQRKIDALAAGELTGFAARSAARHSRVCPNCSARLSDSKKLYGELERMASEMPSQDLRDRVFTKLADAGLPASSKGSESSQPPYTPLPSRNMQLRRRRLGLQVAAGLGFVVVIAAVLFPNFAQSREFARSSGSMMNKLDARFSQDYDESGKLEGHLPTAGYYSAPQRGRVEEQMSGGSEKRDLSFSISQGGEAAKFAHASSSPTANITPAALDRYLIRNATLVIEVKDARAGYNTLFSAVKATKGYLSNLQETVDALGARTITMQVRVPSRLFDSSMQQLSSLGKVMEKHVSAEDVTEEYVDTESTLRNLNRTESRLLEHLGRTGRLSDTLLVEKELTRVRAEIEQREGRLRFLSHRVQFSTVDVTLREEAKAQPAVPPQSYSTGKEATDATRSLVEFLRSVWTTVIWIGIWAVVWVPIGLAGFWLARKAWRVWLDAGTSPVPPSSS